MQNRYAADIGDFIKFALLRHLGVGRRVGVAWYLHPDESHNLDGRHVSYLEEPDRWRKLDPCLFDALQNVATNTRSVDSLQSADILDALYSAEPLNYRELRSDQRDRWRSEWFQRVMQGLESCDLVFADPDNGIVDNLPSRRRKIRFGKQIPLQEVNELARGRVAVIYHHNSRFPGGHKVEIAHWVNQFDGDVVAIRANAYSCRTFFVINPDKITKDKIMSFCERWSQHNVSIF